MSYTLAPTPSYGTGTWTSSPAGATFSPNANTANATATVPSSGTYTFTWTEDNGGGCTSSDDVIIQFSNLSFTNNVVQSTCGNANGEIDLVGSNGIGAYSYSIDGGVTYPNTTGTFTGLLANTYTVGVQDALGCTITGPVTVSDQGGPTLNSVTPVDVTCNAACDGSISINATGATQFSIDNGATFQATNTFSNLCTGTYNIVIENAIGCQVTDVTTINEPTQVTMSNTTTDLSCYNICNGEINIGGTGGTGTLQYSIDGGTTFSLNNDFTGLCAQTYNIVVQDANGCSITGTETLNQPPPMSLSILPTNPTCNGYCDGKINCVPSGGTAPSPNDYSYTWGPAGTGGSSDPYVTGLCEGTYTLTVTDANGCTIDTTITLTAPAAVTIDNIATTDEICGGDCSGTLTISSTGGTQYSIDGGNTYQASNNFTNLCTGSYTVYVQDNTQCQATSTAVIAGPTSVNVVAMSDTIICVGGTATLSAQASGGVGGYTYSWDNGGNTQTINVSPGTAQIYCVTATDANGCISPESCVVVNMYQPLSVLAFSDQAICMGSSASISANASGGIGVPYTYTWDNGLGVGETQAVSPTQTTVYTVSVTDQCESPAATATVTITVNEVPTIGLVGDTLNGCAPVIVTFNGLNVPPGSQYVWTFGDGGASTDSIPTHVFTQPGCWPITLQITTPDGCPSDTTYQDYICVYDYPVADFTFGPQPTDVLNTTIYFTNQSTDAANYVWTFDTSGAAFTTIAENPNYTFPNVDPGTYEVCLVAYSDYGCPADTCKEVKIYDEFLVYVPNAFTPDDDGINDYFFPVVRGEDPEKYEFLVFNRWGQLIYESHHPNLKWDGKYHGVMSQEDVYVWKLSVVSLETKKKYDYIGHVSLLK